MATDSLSKPGLRAGWVTNFRDRGCILAFNGGKNNAKLA
jgi:hypothetical protein